MINKNVSSSKISMNTVSKREKEGRRGRERRKERTRGEEEKPSGEEDKHG